MHNPLRILPVLALLVLPVRAELPRVTLVDTKDRKLDVTVLDKTDEHVKVRTIKGAYHTIKLAQLSQESRDLVATLILPNEYLEFDLTVQKIISTGGAIAS